jgi:CBS domain containing-hemolysin-like protein
MVDLEVESVIDQAEESGAILSSHADLLRGVLEFKDTVAREIMIPRTQVVAIEIDTPFEKVLDLVKDAGHSRYPIYRGRPDQVAGVLYAKDLFQLEREGTTLANGSISALVRTPVFFVAETQKIGDLLRQMQAKRVHLAVVVDEFGGTAGIVTLEDILEEIVGEITDEYDAEEVPDVDPLDDGRLRLAARLPVDDLAELFPGIDADDNELTEAVEAADVETVGGLLAQRLGRVPLPGAVAEVAGLRLLAEGGKDARGRVRITTVLVEQLDRAEPVEEEETDVRAGS